MRIRGVRQTLATHRKDILLVCALLALSVVLLLVPTGFEQSDAYQDSERVRGLILATDNSQLKQYGIVKQGDQTLTIRILSGRFRGREVEAGNTVIGKLELDKVFRPGDRALVVLDLDESGTEILYANAIDHYRIHVELVLVLLFLGLLAAFARWTGVKAAFSFFFAALVIWKVMIPGFLRGIDPVLLSLGVVLVLTAAIVFLVGGLTRKGLIAFLGSMAGVMVTGALSLVFGALFRVHGAVRPFSETLLYSGYPHLDITRIYLSGIFLASSGAVMDLGMDIASAMTEVQEKRPEIGRGELMVSGIRVGRAVIGTMTTTLLLAYSGGYTALLMVFMARGIPMANLFNLSYVSAEILHTLVGSFGLVTVAPFTALTGAVLLAARTRSRSRAAIHSRTLAGAAVVDPAVLHADPED